MKNIINSNYAINTLTIEKIQKGNINNNSKIIAQEGVFFLKEFTQLDTDKLNIILRIEDKLKSKNINIISNIKNIDNEGYFKHEDKLYVLYPFVGGRQVNRKDISLKELRVMGNFIASFHKATETSSFNEIKSSMQTQNSEFLYANKSICKIKEQIDLLVNKNVPEVVINLLLLKLDLLGKIDSVAELSLDSNVIIHGDYQEQNVFFNGTEDNLHITVFDIEKARRSSPSIEIARFILLVCFYEAIDSTSLNKAKEFLNGYNQLEDINYHEVVTCINFLILKKLSSTWSENEYLKTSNPELLEFIRNDYKLLKNIKENFKEIQNLLLKTFKNI